VGGFNTDLNLEILNIFLVRISFSVNDCRKEDIQIRFPLRRCVKSILNRLYRNSMGGYSLCEFLYWGDLCWSEGNGGWE
jgi:hypothetical protein